MMRAKDDYRSLNGLQKAALLVMSVGEDTAAKIFQLMHDDEIREISQTMANLGTVNATVIERLFVEFADQISSTGSLTGTYEFDRTAAVQGARPQQGQHRSWKRSAAPPAAPCGTSSATSTRSVLANFLKNEYPQTVAVVLSKVKPDHGARVLSMLPEAFAMEVIMRMLRMESVQKDILDDVERMLRNEFMSNLARTTRRDAHEMIAEIFNNLDRASESRFLTALEERNRDSAEKVRSLMFTFEDLGKLDPGGVQTLLRNVEKDKLPLCLKGASEALRDLFLSNMSERAVEDAQGGHGRRWARSGCATSKRLSWQWSRSPRSWPQGRDHAERQEGRRRADLLGLWNERWQWFANSSSTTTLVKRPKAAGHVGGAQAKGSASAAGKACRAGALPPPRRAPMFTEAEMQGACDIARRKGEEAGATRGRNEAVAAFDKQVAATLSTIAQQTAAIAKNIAAEAQAAGKSVELALAIVRKLHPALVERARPGGDRIGPGPVPGIAEAGAAPGRLCAQRPARCIAGAADAVVGLQRVRRSRRPDRGRCDG